MLVPMRRGFRSTTTGAVGALARIFPSSSRQASAARAASAIAAISSMRFIVASSRKSEWLPELPFSLMKRPSKTNGRNVEPEG